MVDGSNTPDLFRITLFNQVFVQDNLIDRITLFIECDDCREDNLVLCLIKTFRRDVTLDACRDDVVTTINEASR